MSWRWKFVLNRFWDTFLESLTKTVQKNIKECHRCNQKKTKIRQFCPLKKFTLMKFDHHLTLRAHSSGSESDMNANDVPKWPGGIFLKIQYIKWSGIYACFPWQLNQKKGMLEEDDFSNCISSISYHFFCVWIYYGVRKIKMQKKTGFSGGIVVAKWYLIA